MRRLVITENHGLVTVETSAGVRSTGATVQSALQKLDLSGLSSQEDFTELAAIFNRIRPVSVGQISEGLAGA